MGNISKLLVITLTITIAFVMSSCVHSEHYQRTYKTQNCKGLYSNIYDVYWWGIYKESNLWALYITDSANFRISLGIYGEYDSYGCKIKKDTLYIEKKTLNNSGYPVVIERRKYSLKALERDRTHNN